MVIPKWAVAVGVVAAVVLVGSALGAPSVPVSAPVATQRVSSVDACERPYRERILAAQKQQTEERKTLDSAPRVTDSPAWGRYRAAWDAEYQARDEMKLRCH